MYMFSVEPMSYGYFGISVSVVAFGIHTLYS